MGEELPVVYPLSKFTWDKDLNCLVASIADCPANLRLLEGTFNLGFGVKSHRTGRTVFFRLVDVKRQPDGTIVSWDYEQHYDSVSREDKLLTATILNL